MKIYDITQELYSSCVYPGDPSPKSESLMSITDGDVCNLTAIHMCAHNGTHVDAPYHFINDGETVEDIPLYKTVGAAFVVYHSGIVSGTDAETMLARASMHSPEAALRVLIKGNATMSVDAARVFAEAGVYLVGNESQTVGPEDAPMEVHKLLLGSGAVLLEGIRLSEVPEGVYLLSAPPLRLSGGDGAPCRAILIGDV